MSWVGGGPYNQHPDCRTWVLKIVNQDTLVFADLFLLQNFDARRAIEFGTILVSRHLDPRSLCRRFRHRWGRG